MKRIIVLTCVAMLMGCGRRKAPKPVGFMAGSTRNDILHQLHDIHATVLTNTPDLVTADFNGPGLPGPMRVNLVFREGRVAGVGYVTLWGAH